MRLSGFALGIVGFILLIALTAICSLVSFSFTRDGVIDLWDNGIYVESVGEVAQALVSPRDFEEQTPPISDATSTPFVIPSITPIATVVIESAETTDDAENTPVPDTSNAEPTQVIEPTEQFASEIWGDPREVNILLMGIDEREGFTTENA
ncbi:MAG: hypothetical protein AAFV93_20715, partial [Chloroflexota bacterium]